jgi:hypothetical protein
MNILIVPLIIILIYVLIGIYSIHFTEKKYYEINEIKIRTTKTEYIYLGICLIPIIAIYYSFGISASIYWVFGTWLVFQDEKRFMMSDLMTGLMIVTGIMLSIIKGTFIIATIGTGLIVLQLFLIYAYGPSIYIFLKKLEEDESVEILGAGDIKIAIGSTLMAVNSKLYLLDTFYIIALVYIIGAIWEAIRILFTRKKEKREHVAFGKYIFIGIFVYIFFLKDNFF